MVGGPPSFGVLLRGYRRGAGLSQEVLAERSGLSVRAIRDIERGSRVPRAESVRLLAQALNLSARESASFSAAARPRAAGPALPQELAFAAPATMPPLVGRSGEMDLLERRLSGVGPPVLLLAGEPGIGKSRLLREAARLGVVYGWTVLYGGCQRRDGEQPYAPLLEALEGYLRGLPPARLANLPRGCAWLARLLPDVAALPIEPLPSWTLTPARERRLLFGAVGSLLASSAGSGGTLLLLDDLHWAGQDACDLLAALLRAIPTTPLRVIGAYRDTEIAPRGPLCTAVRSGPRASGHASQPGAA